jgi:hypothetical protein
LNNVDLNIDPPGLKNIKLKDMPNVKLEPFLQSLRERNQLEGLSLIRLESINLEVFNQFIKQPLMDANCFKFFRFEINHDNFGACFDGVVDVVCRHIDNLEHLSFAKTPVSTEQIEKLVQAMNAAAAGKRAALKVLDLSHVYANSDFDFKKVLTLLSAIGT